MVSRKLNLKKLINMKYYLYILGITFLVSCQQKVSQASSTNTKETAVVPTPTEDTIRRAQQVKLPTSTPQQAQLEGPDEGTDLYLGQRLYTTKCVGCHQLMPVKDFTSTQWKKIVPEMAKKAKLDASQENMILKYVLSEVGG